MTFGDQLAQDANALITSRGTTIRLQHFKTQSYSGADYDQVISAQSGNDVWFTAFPQTLDIATGGEDSKLIEQGRIDMDDKKVYMAGSIEIDWYTQVGIGSPSPVIFSVLPNGVMAPEVNGTVVYKKAYIRQLNTGSFYQQI